MEQQTTMGTIPRPEEAREASSEPASSSALGLLLTSGNALVLRRARTIRVWADSTRDTLDDDTSTESTDKDAGTPLRQAMFVGLDNSSRRALFVCLFACFVVT